MIKRNLKSNPKKIGQALAALVLSVILFSSLPAEAKGKKTQASALVELEKLDSAANLLLFTSDATRPEQCRIKPAEAKRLLLAIHPMIDESRKKAISSLLVRSSGKSMVDPKWEKTCSKNCHCGLYASILEDSGDQSLTDKDREAKYRFYKKASMMTSKEAKACSVRTATWFCKSDLLKKLRKEAKEYPNPSLRSKVEMDHSHR